MIKDKLDKCTENSTNINIKEETTTSCDSTSKESGTNEPVIPKKEDDTPSSSTSSTSSVKESPGSRGSSTASRPNSSSNTNAGLATNGNNAAVGTNSVCPTTSASLAHSGIPVTDSSDVSSILDPTPDVPPGAPVTDDTSINDRAPLPPDLQTDTFNELSAPNIPPLRQPPMMQHVRPSPNGIQPLVSNVINKTQQSATNMEVQYMQQQSQIFVFSTMLANKSADAVFQGHFQSIIAYHCAQPGTKKYFEKHPLKLNQFHRPSPAQWLNGLAMMKNKGCTRGNMPGPPPGPPGSGMGGMPNFPPGKPGGPMGMVDNFPGHDGIVDDIASLQEPDMSWEQRPPNHQMSMGVPPNAGPDGAGSLPEPSLDDTCLAGTSTAPGGPNPALMLGHSPCITSTAPTSPSLANLEPSLQGVKVPDEDLTPQQRQHREEQLATLRKMQQILFPEENTGAIDEHEIGGNPQDVPGPPCQNMMPTTSMSGHMEWQKLQNQFFDSKMKNEGPSMGPGVRGMVPMPPGPSQGSASVLSPQVPGSGPGPRLQGPPPPYHQTPRSASVPIALQSPNPASPNNPTSNLSLPSPRTSSALNSPADSNNRQQFTGLNRHFSATQSPTSQNSPSAPGARGASTISNPGTPISSHFSPSASTPATDTLTAQASSGTPGEFPANTPVVTSTHHGVDGMFCRTLQSMAQKQHMVSGVPGSTDHSGSPNKEPNLMPVPSPQQIQYCNTFEGQELTIQKQPNTSLKDRNITSPASLDSGFPGEMCSGGGTSTRVSAPNTPLTPSSVDMGPRFPISNTNSSSDCYKLPAPSPNSVDSKNPRPSPQTPGNVQGPVNNVTGNRPPTDGNRPPPTSNADLNNMRFSNASPLDGHNRYSIMGVNNSPNAFPQQQQPPGNSKPGANMMAVSPSGKPVDPICTTGQRADNVPLNPNSNNGLPGNPKGSHFDPISSLAQMSQLLTSTSSLNGQSTGSGPNMMPYGGVNASPMDMGRPDMGGCVPDMDGGMMGMGPGGPHVYNPGGIGSPKNFPFMSPQRIMRPSMGQGPMPPYNGTNVQVKASAPNTIQYLPARPQMGPTNPRGPPSLDFLTRFANPNMDGKVGGAQNMQYFPGCGPNNNMGHIDGNSMHNDGLMASLMNGPMMGKMGPMSGGMVPQGMMPMGMGGGPGMRNPNGPSGLRPGMNSSIRMHGSMSGFDPTGLGGDGMYPPSGPGGPQMFGPGPNVGPKGPMGRGMCTPEASQPLPPSVGQANAYKNSPFGNATTADPNYAQQFHNFQQQLYATSTRSQLNSQGPGPPPQPQGTPGGNHMYFMSK